MSKKYLGLIFILIILLFALILFTGDENTQNKTLLTVSGESGYYTTSEIAEDIQTHPYYKGYNQSTVDWLKTLDGVCIPSSDGFIVMSKAEADNIGIAFITDVVIEDTISCNIIEKHSIGNDLKNITLVKNVELVSQNQTAGWA